MIRVKNHLCSFTDDTIQEIRREIGVIRESMKQPYETPYAGLFAAQDIESLKIIKQHADEMRARKPTLFLLIGIGGSNMGTLAIINDILGSLHNDTEPPLRFFCADTIDNDELSALLWIVEQELKLGGTIVVCIVTKSGTTAETLINGALFIDLLRKYKRNYNDFVVLITDKQSPLWIMGEANQYRLLEIPKLAGGRYSVFTAVGIFPLLVMGIDTEELCSGATTMFEACLNEDLEQNEAARSACALYSHYYNGYVIHDIFVFSPEYRNLGNWYKQLIGESLGKKYDLAGAIIEIGITPTVSVGTIDLHSVAQLYLGGPRNKITTFVVNAHESETVVTPDNEFSALIPGIAGRPISFIKEAIFKGVEAAYAQEKRPHMVVTLEGNKNFALGQFMMMKMVETIFLGRLFDINPFDQPAVELYKDETRKILSR